MANIDVITYNQPNTGQRLYNSLRHTGFAVIENHPIDKALIDECYRIWRHFFLHEDKSDVAFCPESHAGYIRPELSETAKGAKLKDLKEFFHLYENGPCPTHLEKTSRELMQQLTQLGSELLALLYAECPKELKQSLSMPLPAMLKNCTHQLFRVIHYPPLTGNEPEGALRAAAHADINLITLLPAATAAGLQAQTQAGEWVDVPLDPNWIVINTGDMLQECTQGFFPSTQHRVTNPTGEAAKQSRLSMPLFLHPEANVRLSDRHTAESYRQERFRELGLAKECFEEEETSH